MKHPTARIVSQLGGKADDRAEAPAGGPLPHRVVGAWETLTDTRKTLTYKRNPNLHAKTRTRDNPIIRGVTGILMKFVA